MRSQRLHTLQKAFTEKFDAHSMSQAYIDGANFTLDEFRKHTKSSGLFSEKRFILFTNIWNLSKEDQQQLQSELPSVSEDTILCITAEQPPRKNNALFKALLTADTVEEFTDLSHSELQQFIQQETKKLGATIDTAATQQLLSSFGNNLWALTNEIHKLAHFSSSINEESVRVFAQEQLDDNIFHLTDAIGSKNASKALELLQQQFDSGAAPQYLITMLARHFANLLKVYKTDGGKGLKMHDFVKQKSQQQLRTCSPKKLLQLYWQMLQIDEDAKTGKAVPETALTQCIIDACA